MEQGIVSPGWIASIIDGSRDDIDEKDTYRDEEEYSGSHRSERSTVEDTRVHVPEQSDDSRSDERHDVGTVEDLTIQRLSDQARRDRVGRDERRSLPVDS